MSAPSQTFFSLKYKRCHVVKNNKICYDIKVKKLRALYILTKKNCEVGQDAQSNHSKKFQMF